MTVKLSDILLPSDAPEGVDMGFNTFIHRDMRGIDMLLVKYNDAGEICQWIRLFPYQVSALCSSPDENVEANRQLLLDRSRVGMKKYGMATSDNPLALDQWLGHALEEVLDMANYLQAARAKLKDNNGPV